MRRQFGLASPVSVAASGSHLALGTDANGNPLVAPDGQAPLNDALRHVTFSQSMGDAFDMEDLLSLSYTVETGEAGEGEDPPPPRFVTQRDHQWRNATAGNYLLSENHRGHGELIAPDGSSTGAIDPYNFTVPKTGNFLHQFDTRNTGLDTPDVAPYRGYNPLEFHSYLYEGYRADPLTNQTAASSGFGPGSFVSTPPGSSSWGNLQGGEGGQDDTQGTGSTDEDFSWLRELQEFQFRPDYSLQYGLGFGEGFLIDGALWYSNRGFWLCNRLRSFCVGTLDGRFGRRL